MYRNNQCCLTISGFSKCRKRCKPKNKLRKFRPGKGSMFLYIVKSLKVLHTFFSRYRDCETFWDKNIKQTIASQVLFRSND